MPVPDLIRDSFVGRIVYHVSGRRLFRHPEEMPDFVLPARYANKPGFAATPSSNLTLAGSGVTTASGDLATQKQEEHPQESTLAHEVLHLHGDDAEKGVQEKEMELEMRNSNIVDWYGPDDPECPENVSRRRKTSSWNAI